jgi:methyl-accepting chemotaxis protein
MKDDGYFWADMADGLCVVHYNAANEGAMRLNAQDKEGVYYIQNFIRLGNAGGGYSEFYFGKPGDEEGSYKKRGYTEKFEPYGWYISTGNYYDEIDGHIAGVESERNMAYIMLFGSSLFLAVAGLLILSKILSGRVIKPLLPLTAFMVNAGSTGDIAVSNDHAEVIGRYAQRNDEIGNLIKSSATFINHVLTVSKSLETVANNDLTHDMSLLSDKDTIGLSLKKMSDSLNNMFTEISLSTNQVSVGSKQIADGAQTLAQGATEQAASVEELSSSIAEIAESAKANAATVERTSKLSAKIKEDAEKSSRQMNEMVNAVEEINEANQHIGRIIKTIDDIAFQTNILALNAAVEAAHAGQHGKGFAVVAEEVRNLAAKSAEAAKETSSMIENSMVKANLGSQITGETAESLSRIVSGINESNQLVEEIFKSSEQQALGIQQINIGIDQVAQVVQQNSATAEESAAASEERRSQSDTLQELIAQFKLKDSDKLQQSFLSA